MPDVNLAALAAERPIFRRAGRTTWQVEDPADLDAGMWVEVGLRDGSVRVVYLDRIRAQLSDGRVQARTSGTKIMRAGDRLRSLDGTVSAVTEDQAQAHEAARDHERIHATPREVYGSVRYQLGITDEDTESGGHDGR